MKSLFIAALFFNVLAAQASADSEAGEAFATASIELAGNWSGMLEYRDYQSGEIAQIPHERTISVPPDGSYMSTQLSFSDPGQRVYAAEIATVTGDTVSMIYVRDRQMENQTYTVTDFTNTDDGWTAVLEADGYDAGSPADIRIIIAEAGDRLTMEKQVRPNDVTSFEFRNRVVLRRQ